MSSKAPSGALIKVKLCEVVWLILGVFFRGTAETDSLDRFSLSFTNTAKSQRRGSSCPGILGYLLVCIYIKDG